MPEFLVHYTVDRPSPLPGEGRAATHHALLVEAEDRRDAYLVAFDALTRDGLRVGTMLTNRWKGQIEGVDPARDTHHLDFSDDDLEALREAGVPVDEVHEAEARIERIDPYRVRPAGRVVSRRERTDPTGPPPG